MLCFIKLTGKYNAKNTLKHVRFEEVYLYVQKCIITI